MTLQAMVAGTIFMASAVVKIEPWVRWTLAIIAGGGTAGIIKGATATARVASTVSTGSIANPLISTIELSVSSVLSFFAMFIPLLQP